MIQLKSDKDLEMLRKAGGILAQVMQRLRENVRPGVSTEEIDRLAQRLMKERKVTSAFMGYKGYPKNICTSLNEEIVHGIPSERKIKEGDIVSLDLGINYAGYYSDLAVTLAVGRVESRAKKLIEVTRQALSEGIKQTRMDNNLSDISCAIQGCVEKNGFSVVRQFVGHGIGFQLHEEPEIPNFGRPHEGPLLQKGMVFAIEPMVNMGTWEAKILENKWTAVTKDGLPSAHFEHTVAVTDGGPQILTN